MRNLSSNPNENSDYNLIIDDVPVFDWLEFVPMDKEAIGDFFEEYDSEHVSTISLILWKNVDVGAVITKKIELQWKMWGVLTVDDIVGMWEQDLVVYLWDDIVYGLSDSQKTDLLLELKGLLMDYMIRFPNSEYRQNLVSIQWIEQNIYFEKEVRRIYEEISLNKAKFLSWDIDYSLYSTEHLWKAIRYLIRDMVWNWELEMDDLWNIKWLYENRKIWWATYKSLTEKYSYLVKSSKYESSEYYKIYKYLYEGYIYNKMPFDEDSRKNGKMIFSQDFCAKYDFKDIELNKSEDDVFYLIRKEPILQELFKESENYWTVKNKESGLLGIENELNEVNWYIQEAESVIKFLWNKMNEAGRELMNAKSYIVSTDDKVSKMSVNNKILEKKAIYKKVANDYILDWTKSYIKALVQIDRALVFSKDEKLLKSVLPTMWLSGLEALRNREKISSPFLVWNLWAKWVEDDLTMDFSEYSFQLVSSKSVDDIVDDLVDETEWERFGNWVEIYVDYIAEDPGRFLVDLWSILLAGAMTGKWAPLVMATRFFLLHKAIMMLWYGTLNIARWEDFLEWVKLWSGVYEKWEDGKMRYRWTGEAIVHLGVQFGSDLIFFKYLAPFSKLVERWVEEVFLWSMLISSPVKAQIIKWSVQYFTEVWWFTVLWGVIEPLEAGLIKWVEWKDIIDIFGEIDRVFDTKWSKEWFVGGMLYNMWFVWALRLGGRVASPLSKRLLNKNLLNKQENEIREILSIEWELNKMLELKMADWWLTYIVDSQGKIVIQKWSKLLSETEAEQELWKEIIDKGRELNKKLLNLMKINAEITTLYSKWLWKEQWVKEYVDYIKKHKWDFASMSPEDVFKWRVDFYTKKWNIAKAKYWEKIYNDFVKDGGIKQNYEISVKKEVENRILQAFYTAVWVNWVMEGIYSDPDFQTSEIAKVISLNPETAKDKKFVESLILELNRPENKEIFDRIQELVNSSGDADSQLNLTRDLRKALKTNTTISDWMKRFILFFALSSTAYSCDFVGGRKVDLVMVDSLKIEWVEELAASTYKSKNYEKSAQYDQTVWELYEEYAREYKGGLSSSQVEHRRLLLRNAITHYSYASDSYVQVGMLEKARYVLEKAVAINDDFLDLDSWLENTSDEYRFYGYKELASLLSKTWEYQSCYEYYTKSLKVATYSQHVATIYNDLWDAKLKEAEFESNSSKKITIIEQSLENLNKSLEIKESIKQDIMKKIEPEFLKYFDVFNKDYYTTKEVFLDSLPKSKKDKYSVLFDEYEYQERSIAYSKFNEAKAILLLSDTKEKVLNTDGERVYGDEEIKKLRQRANSTIDETIAILEVFQKNLAEPYFYKWVLLDKVWQIKEAQEFYMKSYGKSAPEAKEQSNFPMRVKSSYQVMNYWILKSQDSPTLDNLKKANNWTSKYLDAEQVEKQQVQEQRETTQQYKSALDKKVHEAELNKRERELNERIMWASISISFLLWLMALSITSGRNKLKKVNIQLWEQKDMLEKQKEELEAQKKELESQTKLLEIAKITAEENEKLAQNLLSEQQKAVRAWSHVQEAVLSSKEWLKEVFPESFLMFESKDEISWDFYWYAEVGWRKIWIVMDCVGHWVMWGMVSMLWNSLLNQIVKQNKITDPAKIMEELNRWFKIFSNWQETIESHYTMDWTIVVVDNTKKTVSVIGANNPPLFISKKWVIEDFKNDPSVGKYSVDWKLWRKYTATTFEYQDGDMIFLWSDWFGDSFGGPNVKKFFVKNLRELIIKNQDKSVEEIWEILAKAHKDWISYPHWKQVDDVSVMWITLK